MMVSKNTREMKGKNMKKAEHYIQNEYACNASILSNWNDICEEDMNGLFAIADRKRR